MLIEQALTILKSHHQKITPTRRRILEQLYAYKIPCNPYDLLDRHPDASIDISTIYRNFELFETLGIIHKIHSL